MYFLIRPVTVKYKTLSIRQIGKDRKGNKKLEFTKKIEGTFYLVSIEKGNNQIGIITLWKKKK